MADRELTVVYCGIGHRRLDFGYSLAGPKALEVLNSGLLPM
jgi:hypothetical protein